MDAPNITVRPLTPSRWGDLETVFNARGCSVPRGCWCMFYRETGAPVRPSGVTLAQDRKERLRSLCEAGPPPGLIAYAERTPVGWVSLGPRADFVKLQRSPVMKPVDGTPVWSIVCFVVTPEYRHRGVAAALLQGAIDYARRRGARVLEAYPIEKAERSRDDSMWFGARSMYDKAGFREVARRRPERPVVRLELAKAR